MLFASAGLIWSLAALIKVSVVLARREIYEFTWWDGGLALTGKRLGRGASFAFAAFCLVLACVCGWLLSSLPTGRP